MKFSFNWLQQLCPFEMHAHRLAEKLSRAGFCVESYEPMGDDWMLDVEVTPNRPDCLSHRGLAREIAALAGTQVRPPEIEPGSEGGEPVEELASMSVEATELCPHYTARVITGVSVGQSPDWMQHRLEVCGIRPVNAVVDVTNYVMLETGQPLHAFDLDLLRNNAIRVRRAEQGETMTAIDGTECDLDDDMLVIADAERPVAIAGIMGGAETEIGSETTNLLLESARFDPVSVRRTSRTLGLSSDSSYRFERGVDPEGVEAASRRASRLLLEHAGGTLREGVLEERFDTTERPEVQLRLDRMNRILGTDIDREEVLTGFRGLELDVDEEEDERLTVKVPSWRSDLRREIDLVEEVARIHGYHNIPETTDIRVRLAEMSVEERCQRRARRLLAGEGFNEIISSALVPDDRLQDAQPWSDRAPLPLRNPVSSEKTHLRLTNMAGLLRAKQFNEARGTERVDLFELGTTYLPRSGGTSEQPREKQCLSLLSDRERAFFVLKGVFANLLDELGIDTPPDEEPGADGPFEEGASLSWQYDDELVGVLGRLSEELTEEMDFEHRPALLEVDFDLLTRRARLDRPYEVIPSFPASRRDLAVVVNEDVLWSDLREVIDDSAPDILETVNFFDIYRGEQIPDGQKSVAFSLVFRSPERTLTSDEVDEAQQNIIDDLRDRVDASLRGN